METPPAVPPVKKSFLRRHKFVMPLLLTINLSAGAYIFLKPKEKEADADKSSAAISQAALTTSTTAPLVEAAPTSTTAPLVEAAPVKKACDPIPEDQQRDIFKWILEEKRKGRPKDRDEKKRIDEEKAILKQFIRAKSIPAI